MRVASVILFLVACSVHLSAGSVAERHFTGKTNYVADTSEENTGSSLRLTRGIVKNQTEEIIFSQEVLQRILEERKTARFLLGQTRQMRGIEAWFFPGTSDKRALVIGGVHGTELSSTEVAKALIEHLLSVDKNFYNVIIIPCLFPDNASTAKEITSQIGSVANIGRYSFVTAPDPNRQMPSPGQPFDEISAKDHLGREIEKENQLLLQLINLFRPERIANIHAIRDLLHAGIYADPRTDSKSYALGFDTDSSLAIEMASLVYSSGGYVPGNQLDKNPTALYYKDPTPVARGSFQARNFSGSSLPANRGSGISLGTWASTAISSANDSCRNRDAMRILTIEFPGYKRPQDYSAPKQQAYFNLQVQLYASSIQRIFLGEYFVLETPTDQMASARRD